jgi:glycosyltransferase involved in cell wall biosynthesis
MDFRNSSQKMDQKMHSLKIGVLLCSYNGERYITEQLESIVNQSVLPQELVIIDDGSSDGTLNIIKSFEFPSFLKVKIIQRSQNLGPAQNFMQGLLELNSDWVCFADQDDIWLHDKIQIFSDAICRFPEKRMIFSNADLIDESSAPLGESLWERIRFDQIKQHQFNACNLDLLLFRPVVTGMSSAVHRLSALEFIEIQESILHDEWLSLQLSIHNLLIAIPDVTALYRMHNQQVAGVEKTFSLRSLLKKLLNNNESPEPYLRRNALILDLLKNNTRLDSAIRNKALDFNEHLNVRCDDHAQIFIKFCKLCSELLNRRYFKYSFGLMSFLKDLKRLVVKC